MPKSPKASTASPAPSPAPGHPPSGDPLAVAPASAVTIAAMLAGFEPKPAVYEPKVAEALLANHMARLQAIAAERLRIPRFDIDPVCGALLSVHALTQAPPMFAGYQAMAAAGQFQLANLDLLRDLTLVLLHVFRQATNAGAFNSNAKVPPALDAASAEVEKRLQKLCEHYFEDDPTIGPRLDRLRPGTGYLDRAYDLFGYADIAEEQLAIVSRDPMFYRPTDIADGRRLAGEILGALGTLLTPEGHKWYDLTLRTWTLLDAVYSEVRAIGLVLLRFDPQREARLPTPYVVGRPGQGRRKKAPPAEPTEPTGDK